MFLKVSVSSAGNHDYRLDWDYFVTYHLGAEPPRAYRIAGQGRA